MNIFAKKNFFLTVLFLTSVAGKQCAFAEQTEVESFTAQRYHVKFSAQQPQVKEKLAEEYAQMVKLAELLKKSDLKDNVDYKVASNITAVNLWANTYMENIIISDGDLKKLYELKKPIIEAKYNFRNILIPKESSADKIIGVVSPYKTISNKLEVFCKYVQTASRDTISKQNSGLLGWFDYNNLDPKIQTALKGKTVGDMIKIDAGDKGWQVFFIEGYQAQKLATFEEAKPALVQIAQKEALAREIDKQLK